jgi:hypothetical protein
MSTEHFFWFVDRAVVDPILAMTWSSFLRRHPWPSSELTDLLRFSIEPEPSGAAVREILARRTLRWTMQRSTPAYFFLDEVVHHVSSVRRASPEVSSSLYETAVLVAVAYNAFLDRELDAKTTQAIFRITGAENPRAWLDLTPAHAARLNTVLAGHLEDKPIFPWLGRDATQDGYSALHVADTHRFMAFLRQAAEHNWPAPRVKRDVMRKLDKLDRPARKTLAFRDCELTTNLARVAKRARFQRPCVLRYFG